MSGINEQGITIKSLDEIVADLEAKFKAIVGETFDTTPESPDGMNIRIFAKYIHDQHLLAEAAYHAYNPAVATGVGLDNLVRLNGITRIEDEPTKVGVFFNAVENIGMLVPAGTEVETESGDYQFVTSTDCVIPGEVLAVCKTLGAIVIVPDEVTVINSNLPSDVTVTNPEAGVTGIVREEDPALRARRDRTTAKASASTAESIYANVSDLNLEFIAVVENDTDAVVDGIPPKSFLTVAEGSTVELIAERIFQCKTIGIKAHGDNLVDIFDSQGYPHTIGVSRPTKQQVWIKVMVTRPSNIAIGGLTDIQTELVNYINDLQIGHDVVWANLFVPATTAAPGITVKTLEISSDGVTWQTSDIPVNILSRAATIMDQVTVEELI